MRATVATIDLNSCTTRFAASAYGLATQKPGLLDCTFNGKTGLAWTQTGLDAVGIVPAGGNAVKGVQLASGIVAGSISAYQHSMAGAGLSFTGFVLAAAENSGARLAVNGVEMVPALGNLVAIGATAYDVFGKDGLVAAYKSCMAGTN